MTLARPSCVAGAGAKVMSNAIKFLVKSTAAGLAFHCRFPPLEDPGSRVSVSTRQESFKTLDHSIKHRDLLDRKVSIFGMLVESLLISVYALLAASFAQANDSRIGLFAGTVIPT